MDFLTAKQLIEYENKKSSITIYPIKHMVCINGFKYFKVSHGTLNRFKYYKKTGFLVK